MPISIRRCRTGLLGGLLGACMTSMAAPPTPEPDGSYERPYPQHRQAAAHVVETARAVLASLGTAEPSAAAPLVTVAHTKAVSPALVDAVRDALASIGARQAASGGWLGLIMETQTQQESGVYTPAPRAGLARPDLVLAIDEAQVAPDLRRVRGALLTLRAGGPEQERPLGAGEIVPGSATSVYVGTTPAPGAAGLQARGEGYCNRDLPSGRWRYTAVEAAKVAAKAALVRARQGETVRGTNATEDGILRENRNRTVTEGELGSVVVVSEEFDASNCRAVVTVTDGRAPPGERNTYAWRWPSLHPLVSLVSIFF